MHPIYEFVWVILTPTMRRLITKKRKQSCPSKANDLPKRGSLQTVPKIQEKKKPQETKKPKKEEKKKKVIVPSRWPPSLIEKYQGNVGLALKGFVGNARMVREIDVLFSSRKQFILFVHGPCGVGKSELVYLMAKKYGFAITTPSKSYFRQSWTMARKRPTILSLDDLLSLEMEDNGIAKELQKHFNVPTPCVVYISSSTEEMYKHFRFLKSTKTLEIITKRMYRPYYNEVKYKFGQRVADIAKGDLRQASILQLEATASNADARYSAFDVAKKILNRECSSTNEALQVFGSTNNFGDTLLFENYPQDHLGVSALAKRAAAFSQRDLHPAMQTAFALQLFEHGQRASNFQMTWTPTKAKSMYFGPDDQRRLLFKVKGPYDSDPISRNHYLHSLRRKFRGMSMRCRNKFRKAHELTKPELQFLLSPSLKIN